MHILEIRRDVPGLAEWMERFDSDPLSRSRSGVRAYRIARAVEGGELTIQLDFDGLDEAEAFRARLEEQWRVQPYGAGRARILESVAARAHATA